MIPHPFIKGEHAEFFREDLGDLEEILTFYLNNDAAREAVAKSGHGHLKSYHSTTARMKYLLDWVRQYTGVVIG